MSERHLIQQPAGNGTTYLYRIYTADHELLYIGITDNITRRLGDHSKQQPWWATAHHYQLDAHPTRFAAETAERQTIRDEHPQHNIVGYTPQPTVIPTGALLTLTQVAQLTNISARTIQRWTRNGYLTAHSTKPLRYAEMHIRERLSAKR